jgi:hypothetical protein
VPAIGAMTKVGPGFKQVLNFGDVHSVFFKRPYGGSANNSGQENMPNVMFFN